MDDRFKTGTPQQRLEKRVRFRNSFFLRIVAGFIAALLIVSVVQLFALSRGLQDIASEIDQQEYWDAAALLANRLQPLLWEELDTEAFATELHYLSILAANFDVYLLSESGEVLAAYPPQSQLLGTQVPTAALKDALAVETPALPLYNRDPAGREVLFSVAPIRIAKKAGYVYVVLNSNSRALLTRTVGQYFILESAVASFVVIALCSTVLALLFYFLLGGRFRALTAVVHAYQRGELGRRADSRGSDELALLAGTLNEMADRLAVAQQSLEQRDLRRRALVADIVHDMRGPATALQLTLERICRILAPETQAQVEKEIRVLQESSELQRVLVQDLFELSKLEAEGYRLALDDVSPLQLLRRSAERYEALAQAQGVSLELEIPESDVLPSVIADQTLLSRAFGNLIENALRYTPAGGSIRLELCLDAGQETMLLGVSDSGPGIDTEFAGELFERGVRDEHARSGLGLGLSIVKRIAELHQFELQVEKSVSEGARIVFAVDLAANQLLDG